MGVDITDNYPVGLHFIKALLVRGEYRQCIQACRDVVKLAGDALDDHPLQKAFVSFYQGLGHDEIARMMHHNSVAKMPAFNAAEQHYLDALEALPRPDQAAALVYLRKLDVARSTSPSEVDFESGSILSPSLVAHDSMDLSSVRSPSPTPCSPTRSQHSSHLTSPAGTVKTSSSDWDDLESHDSFAELLTPKRVLQRDRSTLSLLESRLSKSDVLPRDVSSMSLLAPTPPRKPKGMSQGLMRQIRPGDTPKQYYVPPRLPYSGTGAHLRSKLPQPAGRSQTEPMLSSPAPALPTSPHLPTPVSAFAREETESEISKASTVFIPSPQPPARSARLGSSVYVTAREDHSDSAAVYRLQDHLQAMAEQLRTHIVHVQKCKEQLLRKQAERRMARQVPTTGTPLAPIAADHGQSSRPLLSPMTPAKTPGLAKARSFWSFVPQDVMAADKEKRMQGGRERKWERQRFDPRRYQELCEKALAEL